MFRFTFIVLLVTSPLFAQTADEKKSTIRFVTALQQADGGFIAAPQDPKLDAMPRSSLRATSAAVRAIKYFGGELPSKSKTLDFVKSCYHADSGAFSDVPGGKEDVNVTAVGMMAMAELETQPNLDRSIAFLAKNAKTFEERRLAVAGMEAGKKFDSQIAAWFKTIDESKNADGTFGKDQGKARDTGGVIAMILRSGGKIDDDRKNAVLKVLQDGQRPDGGFGPADSKSSDGETTYRVMRAFHLLGEKPKDAAKLRAFIQSCRNADGGYGPAPGKPSTVGGTYYAAAVGKWLDR